MDNKNEKNLEFVKEQYIQYWEMIRLHSGFSWQIPATGIVAVIAFMSLDPDKLTGWAKIPLIPAFTFLVVSLFSAVMLVHHRRNLLFVKYYEEAIADLEKKYGVEMQVHHIQISPKLKGFQRISSSTSLSIFLLILALGSFGISIYFISTVL